MNALYLETKWCEEQHCTQIFTKRKSLYVQEEEHCFYKKNNIVFTRRKILYLQEEQHCIYKNTITNCKL